MFGWINEIISGSGLFSTLFAFIPGPMLTVLISAITLVIVWFCVKLIVELFLPLK